VRGALSLDLEGRVEPLLAFDTPMAEIGMRFGESHVLKTRLVGALASQARLAIEAFDEDHLQVHLPPPAGERAQRRPAHPLPLLGFGELRRAPSSASAPGSSLPRC